MSLAHNREIADLKRFWQQWIWADFRDFRFTWPGFFRWSAIVIAAFLIAFVVTLYFLDWNQMRTPIARWASHRYGRPVAIEGDLKVDLFRREPHVSIGGLFIGNPAWVGQPQAARIRQTDIVFRLWPALFGRIILPSVRFDRPEFLLVRAEDGRTNWDSTNPSRQGWKIPPIQRFLVRDGHVEIHDAVRRLEFVGSISSEENSGGQGAAFQLNGSGALNANPFLADIHGGPLINVDESKPYSFSADLHAGPTHAAIDGVIAHPFHLGQFDAHVTATGQSLSELYYLTGVALPGTAPYKLNGRLQRDGALYALSDLAGTIGDSDMHGYLTVDVSHDIPTLGGHLSSRSLDFNDLGALLRGGEKTAAATAYLLPDVTLHTERLRQINGEVDYDADSIRSRDFPLRGLTTHIRVKDGVMRLSPLAFSFTQGKLSGALTIDARKSVPVTSVDARITDLHIEHFIKSNEKPLTGLVEARAQLSGSGASVHKVASSARGIFTAVAPQGGMKKSLAEWAGVNVLSALGLSLSGDQSATNLRCAVMHFDARDGLLSSQQIVLDTDPTRIDGHGTVNLKDETLNLTLQGKPKHFQLLHLNAPITLSGKLESPTVGVDAKPALTQGAIGLGLGLLSPFAAIFAFVDPGLAKEANCADLLADANSQGASVKTPAKPTK
ncbi:MAG TPA: AsmA family protein [Rhizomicrobium sp.]|nr:AsmA family protein [Rhizomicrobium sp.]